MTKEQVKAIETAKNFTKMDFSNPIGWTGYYDTELKELSQAIKTVLSMLKEKDKEIKTLTQTNKSYKGIINKKDRQIDLMARAFKQDDVRTVEEIKQYFERKSEE